MGWGLHNVLSVAIVVSECNHSCIVCISSLPFWCSCVTSFHVFFITDAKIYLKVLALIVEHRKLCGFCFSTPVLVTSFSKSQNSLGFSIVKWFIIILYFRFLNRLQTIILLHLYCFHFRSLSTPFAINL